MAKKLQIGAAMCQIWSFYYEGFKSMTVGKKLWALIIAKLVLFFLVMKLFFMPDLLHENYNTDQERATAVRSALSTKR